MHHEVHKNTSFYTYCFEIKEWYLGSIDFDYVKDISFREKLDVEIKILRKKLSERKIDRQIAIIGTDEKGKMNMYEALLDRYGENQYKFSVIKTMLIFFHLEERILQLPVVFLTTTEKL